MVEGKCRCLLLLPLLCATTRSFVLGPEAVARISLQRPVNQLCRTPTTHTRRMVDMREIGESAAPEESASFRDILKLNQKCQPQPPSNRTLPNIPFVYKTDEELFREFPDAPKAPARLHLSVNGSKMRDVNSGNVDTTSGGKLAARSAIEAYEEMERERIHLTTASRVLNYEAVAAEEARKEGQDVKMHPIDREITWKPFPEHGPPAVYTWDEHPQLITFTGFEVLYNYVEPIGLILRQLLGAAWNWEVRLPGPDAFEANYKKVYEATTNNLPMFGLAHNVTTEEWWYHVICDTYLKTILDYDQDPEMVLNRIDEVFHQLFYEIMVGPECYELVPDVSVVLNRLANWRDKHNGPKLAVLTNEDERTSLILENLGILPYFDFVLNSREMAAQKPWPQVFQMALDKANVTDPRKAIHVGYDYENDIAGACEEGWEAACVKPRQNDWEEENEPYQYHRLIEFEELLLGFGLPTLKKKTLLRRRGHWWGDPIEDAHEPE